MAFFDPLKIPVILFTLFLGHFGEERSCMFTSVFSGAIVGVEGRLISVEADISDGFPVYAMVGYLASEVKEAKERVMAAIRNAGFYLPAKRIIINLSPADIRKEGTAFDLPIAVSILAAMGQIRRTALSGTMIAGELSLNGAVAPVRGILPLVCLAKAMGIKKCVIPYDNLEEGRLVKTVQVIGMKSLSQTIACLNGEDDGKFKEQNTSGSVMQKSSSGRPELKALDFAHIYGQELLKRGIEVAASGMHHLLMVGTPGTGKSMAAQCIPSILPEMTFEESLEVTKIHSVAGLIGAGGALVTKRPFRQPHHSISGYAMIGGGMMPKPGEISLAHHGVLFLDELAEFSRRSIEVLRQPLENRKVTISRTHGRYEFPANFMLVAAMNPCPCGYYPDRERCQCSARQIRQYIGKISQAMLDRFDIGIEMCPISFEEMNSHKSGKSSAQMKQSVERARAVQRERFRRESFYFNGQMDAEAVLRYCVLKKHEQSVLKEAYSRLGLSARGYHKILKTARTIADMDGSADIEEKHLHEAICYRSMDKKYWGMV